MTHLLVTNDYPPKVGGIQSYLFELWRRIPSEEFAALTPTQRGDAAFDANAGHRIVRLKKRALLPRRSLVSEINELARSIDASLVVLDPVFPLALVGPKLELPYAIVLHGAEVTVPSGMPAARARLAEALKGASLIIAAGNFPAQEARRIAGAALPRTVIVPPGVDTERFRPLDDAERAHAREQFGIEPAACLVVSVSRLVPRKGMDVLVEAAGRLSQERPDLRVVIAGKGRDERRLRSLIEKSGAPVRLLGPIDDERLPLLYGCADVFAMLARTRWLGLEQEGFGIVYLEAAACAVAQVAGMSGGTIDAVQDGVTGLVVDRPGDVVVATEALRRLVDDNELRISLGAEARRRAVSQFSYDLLAAHLADELRRSGS